MIRREALIRAHAQGGEEERKDRDAFFFCCFGCGFSSIKSIKVKNLMSYLVGQGSFLSAKRAQEEGGGRGSGFCRERRKKKKR